MESTDIPQLRLQNHCLLEGCATVMEVARHMGALQAQDFGQAAWALAVRTQAPALGAVEQAFEAGQLALTWPMRGTLHFVPAEDAAWMLRLLAPRIMQGEGARLRQLELNEIIIDQARTAFYEALRGGGRLSRAEMMQVLEQAGITTQGQRGYHLLRYTALKGLICLGPLRAKQQTFVLLEEWAPKPRNLSREESLAKLARRYFTSHGPATVHDFATWSGLTLTDARQGLEAISTGLAWAELDGRKYWMGEPKRKSVAVGNNVQLLPGFDEYLLGYKDRQHVLAAEHASKVVPGGNGIFKPMVVANGQILGTWQRTLRKGAVDISLTLFDKNRLMTMEEAAPAAQRFCQFLGLPLGTLHLV